jgi:hypothetical protein
LPLFAEMRGAGHPLILADRDFVNYWMGSRLALLGQELDLFRIDLYSGHLEREFGPQNQPRNWSYPPHYLLMMLPLGFMPYTIAAVAFLLATFALFALAAFEFRRADAPEADRILLWAAVGAFLLVNVNSLQNGFLTGALLLFGLAFRGRRPVLAGIAFGLLTVKPQLGLLVPLLLLAERDWSTILWSAVVALALVGLSTAIFGIGPWRAYLFETARDQQDVLTEWSGRFLYMMPTVYGAARSLGLDPGQAALLQGPVSIAAAAAAVWLFVQDRSRVGRSFALLCATFLVSPYGFDYDMGALAVGAALLASGKSGSAAGGLIAAVAFLPSFVVLTGVLGAPVAPLVLGLALLWRVREVTVAPRGRAVS